MFASIKEIPPKNLVIVSTSKLAKFSTKSKLTNSLQSKITFMRGFDKVKVPINLVPYYFLDTKYTDNTHKKAYQVLTAKKIFPLAIFQGILFIEPFTNFL